MNDLTELKEAWGEPGAPSPGAHAAARAALLEQIAAAGTAASAPVPAPRRPRWRGIRSGARLGWLTAGVAAAAAVAAAVVFATGAGPAGPARPGAQATPGTPATPGTQASGTPASGRQILLAAASVAETRPATTGTYWHLREVLPEDDRIAQTLNTWTAHDGTLYSMPQNYTGVLLMQPGGGFSLGGTSLTLAQLEGLPTDPAGLTAWLTNSYQRLTDPARGRSAVPASDVPGMVAEGLDSLLWQLPAPPTVRAAAFGALAAMPNVTDLGAADGGRALRITFPAPPADKYPNGKLPAGVNQLKLVIDPATSMLLSSTDYQGTTRILAAEWTNDLPPVISPPSK